MRAAAVGLSGVIVALHLAFLNLSPSLIGFVVSLGLAGTAVGTWVVTSAADRLGRRRTLILLAVLMALGGLAFAGVTKTSLIMASALLGMVNGMGRDRGPGLTVEQAEIAQVTNDAGRTKAFAWYNVAVDMGHAVGALVAFLPAFLRAQLGMPALTSYRWTWLLYSILCLAAGALVFRISKAVEINKAVPARRLSPSSRPIVAKFALLSGLDSLGGGFLTTALLSYWFFKRFGVDETVIAPLFFAARIANGFSHLGAAWIAKRIGLVNTMVFTHLPSSFLLMTVPLAPNLPVAVALFLMRESLVEMDVPTRQSYIVAVVREEERTRAAGITNLTRNIAWAVAPAAAGSMMRLFSLSAPLVVGPGLKVVYDLLLFRAFRHIKPPEER